MLILGVYCGNKLLSKRSHSQIELEQMAGASTPLEEQCVIMFRWATEWKQQIFVG